MNYIKPYVTNDISSPCSKCFKEMVASCCGCSEWFAWASSEDQQKTDHEYI